MNAIWYHGSPLQLTVLRQGSTITRDRHLAEVFSHKPEIVSLEDDGTIRHNGTLPGFLYRIDEPVGEDDVYPHPRTTMGPGKEWLTRRDLKLALIGAVEQIESEFLSAAEIEALKSRMSDG
ncbi:MAG: hypothetical protein JW934_08120 [Anaerolineae bacterium]|nr:hypothetical protein [Anaerolineae bacterium]